LLLTFDGCVEAPVSKQPHTVANKSKVQTIRREAKKHSAPVFVGLLCCAVAVLDGWRLLALAESERTFSRSAKKLRNTLTAWFLAIS